MILDEVFFFLITLLYNLDFPPPCKMVIITYLVRVFGGLNVFMILKQLRTPPGTSGVSNE